MKKSAVITAIVLSLSYLGYTQECGPSCPVCSGTGEGSGALLAPKTLLATGIYIPDAEEEVGVINLRYGLLEWIDIGAGYTVEAKKSIWSIRLSPIAENEDGLRPGIILGTGSVQTGGSDQSAFFQLTKSWEFKEGYAVRLAGGVASLVPDFDKGYGIAGVTLTVTERFSPFVSYDGESYHYGLAWIPTDWLTIGGLMVENEYPAVTVGYRFSFANNE
jgi:hypothetical protein